VLEDIIVEFVALEIIHQAVDQIAFFEKKITLELSFEAANYCKVNTISDFNL